VLGTDLLLVRHGEAHCNVAGVAGGDLGCTGLTERGHEQARRAGGRLRRLHAERPFDVMFVSPRLRVRETAAPIAAALGLSPVVEPRLSGPDHGEADGKPWSEIWAAFGGSPADEPDRPFAVGAESWNQFVTRAAARLEEILACHQGKRVLVVAHAETVEVAHGLLLGLPAGAAAQAGFVTAHASVSWWSYRTPPVGPARWHLVTHNATAHLEGPGPM
jgi:probable phosphoglycerate mutase